jgi:serpin B
MGRLAKPSLIAILVAVSALSLAAPFAPASLPAATASEADNRQKVAEAQASLAWKLIERAAPGADAMVSPASLASAFSALSVGADVRMKAAMFKAVGFGVPTDEAETLLAMARKTLAAADPAVFVSADRLVFPPGARPSERVVASLAKLGASCVVVDVSTPGGVKAIDDWVDGVTKGLIPQILGAPLERPEFVALNALYFKGKWKEPFDPKATAEAPFVGVDGKALPAMLMRLPEAERAFRAEKNFIGVDLPFAGDRYSLTIVTSTDKPKALKEFASVKDWLSGAGFAPRQGDLALPRYSLETQSDLMPSLGRDLEEGLKSPTAFSGFGAGAKIDGILQRAKIEVDEQGATAAAATAVFVARALAVDDALHMVVDKPYLFALRDRQSGFILIAGYVAKAPKGKGA